MQIRTTAQYLFPPTEINTGFCFALFCCLKTAAELMTAQVPEGREALRMKGFRATFLEGHKQLVSRVFFFHPIGLLLGTQSKK